MVRVLAAGFSAALLLTAETAAAEWKEKDVQKLVEQKKEGKPFIERGGVDAQIVEINAGPVVYYVDTRTQLCFAAEPLGHSVVVVPCAAVKKGFPVFAPLITWEP